MNAVVERVMSLKESAQEFIKTNATLALAKNVRRYSWQAFYGQRVEGYFGQVDPKPIEGKVFADDGDWVMVKKGNKAELVAFQKSLLASEVAVGKKMRFTPYARKDFDGVRLDESEPATYRDGIKSQVINLTGKKLHLPIAKAQNPYLNDLVVQIEGILASGKARTLAQILADVGASDFHYVDDIYENDGEHQSLTPAIYWTVNKCHKYSGKMGIIYNRAADDYEIALIDKKIETVYVMDLADRFEEILDDGAWKQILVESI